LKELLDIVAFIANCFTVVASGIAIFIFVMKRETLSSVFSALINYTYQMSLTELKEKLERLNDLSTDDDEQHIKIINIFHEIMGQIRGNDKLKLHFKDILSKMEDKTSVQKNKKNKLSEPEKRAIISEFRELIRNLKLQDVQNIDHLIGHNNESDNTSN
jgi:hypothetical protein